MAGERRVTGPCHGLDSAALLQPPPHLRRAPLAGLDARAVLQEQHQHLRLVVAARSFEPLGPLRPLGHRMAAMDPLIEALKRDVDRTLLRENLRRTPEERVLELMELLRAAEEFARAGRRLRGEA